MAPPILDPIRGALLRSQPDARLVALAREGRERAIEEIVRRYRAPLVAFAAMIVPEHRADDVVQESLLRAFDALGASQAEIQLRPWLFRIVRNQALNDIRDTPVSEELTEDLDGVATPDQIAERREEVAALIGGLHALPDAQREAIVGRELEGRGHAEIAAELRTSPGAVRQLIFRARATLRGAAGVLIPLPLLRLLLGPGGGEVAGAATTAGVGAAAATAGGGAATGAAGKVAVGLAGVALAVGGGIAAERGSDRGDRIASANDRGAEARDAAESGAGLDESSGSGPRAGSDSGPGAGESSGPGGGGTGQPARGDGHRGPGGGGEGRDGRDEDGDDDSSGPGSPNSGHGGSGEDSGEEDLPEAEEDTSGHSGSGSSGSGSSGSGSSGSGSSGSSGSGSSDSSGSGSSGSSGSGSSDSSGPSDSSGSSGSGSSGSGSSGPGRFGSSDELEGG